MDRQPSVAAPDFPLFPSMPTRFRPRSFVARLFLACLAFACSAAAWARDWHVSGDGDDARAGTSADTAFRTLARAAAAVEPGDTVWVGDGIYTSNDGQALLALSKHGRPDAWMTWRAAPGARPELRPTGWNGILITGSYIVLDGLHVVGGNDSLTLIDALADAVLKEKDGKPYPGNPRFNTNGILIDGRKVPPDAKPHHIIIRNCVVAKNPGSGIGVIEADHVTIEDNLVFENAWYTRYACSGISMLYNWAHDDAPGYHFIVRRNRVWGNKCMVPWIAIGKLSDGNGIIVDVTEKRVSGGAANPTGIASSASDPNAGALKPERPEWTHRTLIENNLSAFNGGSGIHTFRAAHVDIVNNTTYWNGSVVGYEELFANRSNDIVILNNIIVPRPGGKVTSNHRNGKNRWDHNLYPVAQDVVTGPDDVVGDPLFVKVARDLREADFRLREGSPAIDSGTTELLPTTDIDGRARPASRGPDRGAHER
jgi:hypothetical protein